jgi:hypothetical protein
VVTFEVWVDGVVPEALLIEPHAARVAVQPVHTVLRGSLSDQAGLHEMINRLYGFGLELIDLRRVPTARCQNPCSPGRPPSGAKSLSDGLYEVRVRGLLGPVLRSALPELVATPAGPTTLISGSVAERAQVDALIDMLSRCGARVTTIRYLAQADGQQTGHHRAAPEGDTRNAPGTGEICHPRASVSRFPEDGRGWSEPL